MEGEKSVGGVTRRADPQFKKVSKQGRRGGFGSGPMNSSHEHSAHTKSQKATEQTPGGPASCGPSAQGSEHGKKSEVNEVQTSIQDNKRKHVGIQSQWIVIRAWSSGGTVSVAKSKRPAFAKCIEEGCLRGQSPSLTKKDRNSLCTTRVNDLHIWKLEQICN